MPDATHAFLDPAVWAGNVFDGTWRGGTTTAETTEPATGQVLGTIGLVNADDIAEAGRTALIGQRDWAARPFEDRTHVLRTATALAEEHADEIVEWIVRESGSTKAKAGFELSIVAKALAGASGIPSRSVGEILPSADGRLSLARRRPVGVVGVIAPFNFPLYLAMRAVAPAIAYGNAVILKPDPRTSVCGGYVIARLFELAGLPAGVLHVLPGDGTVGAALTADPSVAMIQFTGSTAAGRRVGEAAGRHLKKVSLELGGKNSLLVLEDADLDIAAANAAWGAYLHQGQICMSTGRVLAHRSIHDELVERIVDTAKNLPVGAPWTAEVALGPLIDAGQRQHARQVLDDAVEAGAQIVVGGGGDGLFLEPTVLTGVTRDNPAFREEIFAPVAVVTPFDSDEEAADLANDTEYGLSMAVISSDVGRAMALGEKLRTGLLHINDQTVNDDVINPFGGVGASGNGTSIGGPSNGEEFTQWQWTTIQREAPHYPM